MAKDEGKITYDSLSKIYREEMGSSTLTVIRKDFYVATQELLAELTKECDRLTRENPDSTEYDLVSGKRRKIQNRFKQIVDMRISKIAILAVLGAKGSPNVLDELTAEEKDYYTKMEELSKTFLKLSNVRKKEYISQDITEIPKAIVSEPVEVEKAPEAPVTESISVEDIPLSEIPVDDAPEEEPIPPAEIPNDEDEEEPVAVPEEITEEEVPVTAPEEIPVPAPVPVVDELNDDEMVVVRILEDMEPFSGMDDLIYDLKKEDIVRLPSMFARVLISRGKARIVSTA